MGNIRFYLKVYAVALAAFLVVDAVWIIAFAGPLYQKKIGHLLADSVNWIAAVIFYLMFIAGLVFFAVRPVIKNEIPAASGLFKSVIFGLMTYGTFSLTNLALIDTWPVSMAIVDMIWGMTVSVLVGWVSINVGKYLG